MRTSFAVGLVMGLIAGASAGIVFTVVIFAAWFNPLSQALVGVGTLLVSFVALYQTRLGVQERHKRDLAERVYTPLRAEVVKWVDLEEQTFSIWNDLREKELYWTNKVPKDMVDLLDTGKQVFRRPLTAKIAAYVFTFEETARLGNEVREKLGLPAQVGSPPTISVRAGYQDVGTVDPLNLWLSQKSVREYVQALVDKKFPNQPWTVVFLLDGKTQGGLSEAEDHIKKVTSFYEGKQETRDLRKYSDQLRELGSKLLPRIDEELR